MLRPVEQGRLVDPEWAQRVVSPPYDALSPGDRAAHVASNPDSFLHVTRSRGDEQLDDAARLRLSKEALGRLLSLGAFAPAAARCLFLYRLSEDDHVQTGIVGELPVAGVEDGRILVHEKTRPDRVESLADHLLEIGVMSSPVALTYRADPALDRLVAQAAEAPPDVDVVVGTVRQTVWAITDDDTVDELLGAFQRQVLYITDGHHRTAAAVAAHARRPEIDTFLAVCWPHDQLRVRAFHRVLTGEPARRLLDVCVDDLAALDEWRPPRGQGEAVVRAEGRWWRLALHPVDTGQVGDHLAVNRLQDGTLRRLGIVDPRTDDRLDTLPSADAVERIVERVDGSGEVAVLLDALPLRELFAVADAGETLPPKSTSFEPKVRSGLFLRQL